MSQKENTKRLGELLRVLFEILEAHPEGMRAKDALHGSASPFLKTSA